jgi:hypothetical protein
MNTFFLIFRGNEINSYMILIDILIRNRKTLMETKCISIIETGIFKYSEFTKIAA